MNEYYMAESVSDISFVDKPYGLKGEQTQKLCYRASPSQNGYGDGVHRRQELHLFVTDTHTFRLLRPGTNYKLQLSLCSLFDAPSNSLSFCLLFLSQWITFVSLFLPFVFSLSFLLHDVAIGSSLLLSLCFFPLVLKDFIISHNSSFCGCRIFVLREFCAFFGTCILLSVKDFSAIVHAPALFFRLISGLSFG